jgi:hypothetical protein
MTSQPRPYPKTAAPGVVATRAPAANSKPSALPLPCQLAWACTLKRPASSELVLSAAEGGRSTDEAIIAAVRCGHQVLDYSG